MDLRPLRISEVIDAAFHMYRIQLATCLRQSSPFVALAWFLLCVLSLTGDPESFGGTIVFIGIPTSVPTLGMVVIMYATAFAVLGACINTMGDAFGSAPGPTPGASRSHRNLGRRILGVTFYVGIEMVIIVGLTLLAGALRNNPVALAFVDIGVIGIALCMLVFSSVLMPAMVIERVSLIRSLRRSLRLVTPRYFAVLGTLLLSYIMISAVMFVWVLGAPFALFGIPTPGAESAGLVLVSLASVLALFVLPFVPALTMSIYFDLRVRLEGLDLAIAAQQVGTERKAGIGA